MKCTPSTPAPARKRRRPNQDLQERLARCEELLKEYATSEKAESPAAQPWNVPTYDDPYLKWQPKGKLVKEDGGVRFMDSFLLGTVYDEVCAPVPLFPCGSRVVPFSLALLLPCAPSPFSRRILNAESRSFVP